MTKALNTKVTSNLFKEEFIFLSKKNKKNILKLDIKEIKSEFNKKGILLLRNFNFDIQNINQFTDKFTTRYANDAIRRKKRFEKKKYKKC